MKYELFGVRLKQLRQEKGFTQENLGKILMVNKSSISRYEKNEQIPEINTLHKISEVFNVTLDYLLGKSDFRDSDDLAEKLIEAFEKEGIPKEEIDLKLLDKVIKTYKIMKD